MSGAEAPDEPADLTTPLVGLMLPEETVSGLLLLIVGVAVSGVEGVSGASVSLLVRGGEEMETPSASSEIIRDIDHAQYREDAGPCVQATRSQSWPVPAAGAARGLARQAAVVLAAAANLTSAEAANQRLERAVATRDLINQARGVLMARESIGGEEAFDVLRRDSQRTNRKVRDVAASIVFRAGSPGGRH